MTSGGEEMERETVTLCTKVPYKIHDKVITFAREHKVKNTSDALQMILEEFFAKKGS